MKDVLFLLVASVLGGLSIFFGLKLYQKKDTNNKKDSNNSTISIKEDNKSDLGTNTGVFKKNNMASTTLKEMGTVLKKLLGISLIIIPVISIYSQDVCYTQEEWMTIKKKTVEYTSTCEQYVDMTEDELYNLSINNRKDMVIKDLLVEKNKKIVELQIPVYQPVIERNDTVQVVYKKSNPIIRKLIVEKEEMVKSYKDNNDLFIFKPSLGFYWIASLNPDIESDPAIAIGYMSLIVSDIIIIPKLVISNTFAGLGTTIEYNINNNGSIAVLIGYGMSYMGSVNKVYIGIGLTTFLL